MREIDSGILNMPNERATRIFKVGYTALMDSLLLVCSGSLGSAIYSGDSVEDVLINTIGTLGYLVAQKTMYSQGVFDTTHPNFTNDDEIPIAFGRQYLGAHRRFYDTIDQGVTSLKSLLS